MEREIPRDRIEIRSSRSGGPGGQHVNKVSTKVEIRFRLEEADWIPLTTRARLRRLQKGRINKKGEMVIVSARHRQRERNLEDCFEKLGRMIDEASVPKKKRIPTRPTKKSRQKRLQEKRRRSSLKESRKRNLEEDA